MQALRNITGLLISGVIEFESRAIIIGSLSSQRLKVDSLDFGLVLRKWLSSPFSLRVVWIDLFAFAAVNPYL